MKNVIDIRLGVLALVTAASLQAGAALADTPVAVELFTSQACSSCPPADALLARLAKNPGVVALAFHVDYWDYLGWKDTHSNARFSDRQRSYAALWHERTVYTPQIVLNGETYMIGSQVSNVEHQIDRESDLDLDVRIRFERSNGRASITVEPLGGGNDRAELFLARFIPLESVRIERGENRGKTIDYANIVTGWERIGSWNGKSAQSYSAELDSGHYAVILQESGQGRILAASYLQ